MVGLIHLLLDLIGKIKPVNFFLRFWSHPNSDSIVVVRRFPPRKILRAHQLGLTLALFLALLSICVNYNDILHGLPWFVAVLMSLVLVMGTLYGGLFVILVGLSLLPFWLLSIDQFKLLQAIEVVCRCYFGGYMLGAILSSLYNDLVRIHLAWFCKDLVKTAFAFDFNRKVNIIKSPIENQEVALLHIIKPLTYYTYKITPLEGTAISDDEKKEFVEKIVNFIQDVYKDDKTLKKDKERLESILADLNAEDFDQRLIKLKEALLEQDEEKIKKVENEIEPIIEKYLQIKKQKLYNYRIKADDVVPYTIAFVANPKILGYKCDFRKQSAYVPDPILANRDLFLRSVDQALHSFETDEVLGRPEIWSQIRIVAIFDEALADANGVEFGMVQPYHNDVDIEGTVAENLLDPMEQMQESFERIVAGINPVVSGLSAEILREIRLKTDVIFALSASEEFTRATAHYSDWIESDESFRFTQKSIEKLQASGVPADIIDKLTALMEQLVISKERFLIEVTDRIGDAAAGEYEPEICDAARIAIFDKNVPGVPFRFNPNPCNSKGDEINVATCSPAADNPFTCVHEFYAAHPGRVALNVLKANSKTYIHEFAHAMSSAYHGAIVDEYFDRFEVLDNTNNNNGNANPGLEKAPFCANRIERKKTVANKRIVPVHKLFARYEHIVYQSDMKHPSSEEDWLGYFPERETPYASCTMDRNYGSYRFDKLISHFMYDRLIAKINRPK